MAAPASAPPARGGGLRTTIAGRPAWQWIAIVGGVGGAVWYIVRKRSGASSAATATDTSGGATPTGIDPATGATWSSEGFDPFVQPLPGSTTGDNAALDAIVKQGQAEQTSDTALAKAIAQNTAATKADTAADKAEDTSKVDGSKKVPPGTPGGVGSKISPTDFPKQIAALTAQGKKLVTFATIKNGKISGKNVGQSGAPVYALTDGPYGPIWVQGFTPSKLKNGTKIATLPQFKSDIKG